MEFWQDSYCNGGVARSSAHCIVPCACLPVPWCQTQPYCILQLHTPSTHSPRDCRVTKAKEKEKTKNFSKDYTCSRMCVCVGCVCVWDVCGGMCVCVCVTSWTFSSFAPWHLRAGRILTCNCYVSRTLTTKNLPCPTRLPGHQQPTNLHLGWTPTVSFQNATRIYRAVTLPVSGNEPPKF